MTEGMKTSFIQILGETFHELPGWKKAIVVFTIVVASPALSFLLALMAVALFPLALAGRFEGDMGKAPLKRSLVRSIHDQEARTRRYYAS